MTYTEKINILKDEMISKIKQNNKDVTLFVFRTSVFDEDYLIYTEVMVTDLTKDNKVQAFVLNDNSEQLTVDLIHLDVYALATILDYLELK